jgi:hypothetical protein
MGCSLTPPDAGDVNDASNTGRENLIPRADAGLDQWLAADQAHRITLDGSGSQVGDGQDLTYRWFCSHEGALFSPDNQVAAPSLSLPGPGVYILMLVVDDGLRPSEPDFITITVGDSMPPGHPPVADAGEDIASPASAAGSIFLDGSGSYDTEAEPLTYRWFCSHEAADFSPDSETVAPTLSLPGPGVYVLMLVVNDGTQPSEPDFITVTIEAPPASATAAPVAIAGPDQTVLVTQADAIRLDGSPSYDPEAAPLTYQWHCSDEGARYSQGPDIARPEVSLPGPGVYVFALVVNDGELSSAPDFLTITVTAPDAWVDSELVQDIPAQDRYRTVQAAIDAVADGTDKLIALDNGPYDEQVSVANNVSLYGMRQPDGSRPLIHHAVGEEEAVIVLGAHAVLESLQIACDEGPGDPSQKSAISVDGTDTQITSCRCDGSHSDGISLRPQSGLEMRDTILQNLSGEGIVAHGGTTLTVFDSRIMQTGGSAVWGLGARLLHLENSVIYQTGWHGVDVQSGDVTLIDHCSIIDFSTNDSGQAGLIMTDGRQVTITNNLILIQDRETLIGMHLTTVNAATPPEVLHNYLYSNQNLPQYYSGELDMGSIHESNLPNAVQPISQDPLLVNPEAGDFRVQSGSPVIGRGENGENCGAIGGVLIENPVY